MANIINPNEKENANIQKFSFEQLKVNEEDIIAFEENPFIPFPTNEEPASDDEKTVNNEEKTIFDTNERETLLEKIDQLTSDVVRLQMELEKAQSHLQEELEKAKQEAYERGKNDAIQAFQEESAEELEELKSQFIQSITKLEEKKHQFDQTLTELENELVETALLLAKKVILKEVEQNSSQVALEIAKYLIKNIQESSQVTLKVNPVDFNTISSHFKESLIKIEADEAIQKGGVVLIGGEENIDGTILTRYKQALQFLQKES